METIKRQCNAVMLPVNVSKRYNCTEGLIVKCIKSWTPIGEDPKEINKLSVSKNWSTGVLDHYEPQHLYFTSDEEIKEEDYCIIDLGENTRVVRVKSLNGGHQIYNVDIIEGYAKISDLKKIIASTDKLLIGWDYKNDILSGDFYNKFVPQIPKQFIEYYISEYNAGRKIDKADVEFEGELYGGVYAIPKISANNEISIKPVEEKMYSREEVVELIKDFTMSTHQLILNKNPQRHEIINTWFKENLK